MAWDTNAAAAATKKPVCEPRSLSTPPLPGAGAARHGQGPVSQGQRPRGERPARLTLLQCHDASAAAGSLPIRTAPSPRLSEPEPPKQLLL